MTVRCPCGNGDGSADFTEVHHLKVFRNLPCLRFEGMIHEQIIPAINAAGGQWEWTDLFLVHSGSDHSAEGQARKLERDLRILHKELKQRPNHPFTLFNLGMTYRDARDYEKAVGFLRRSIQHSKPQESQLRKTYAYLVDCYTQLGRADEAWSACDKGLALFPEDIELRFLQAGLLHERGRHEEAVRVYRSLFRKPSQCYFSSMNRGITGFLARQNLALVYTDMGDLPSAEEQWRLVVQEQPRYRAGWRGLGDTLLKQHKMPEALDLAEQLIAGEALRAEGLVLRGQVAAAGGHPHDARHDLESAVANRPDDPDLREPLCRFLFDHADPHEAEGALKELIGLDPQNAAAHHNLGTTYLRLGRPEDAVEAFQQSLQLRPNASGTWLELGNALETCGRVGDAVAAWEQALRLDPGNDGAKRSLRQARVAHRAPAERIMAARIPLVTETTAPSILDLTVWTVFVTLCP
jgi:tetratricopeptide (TPR) repeat protein